MVSTGERIPILISGAGNMGGTLINHCLASPKLLVNIFIRDPSKYKELVARVEAKGGKVFVGDAEQVEVLEEATKGIHTVVNTLYPRNDEVKFVYSQKLLIDAAVKNGVKRFYPNEYGLEDKNCTEEHKKIYPAISRGQAVLDYLKTQPIKPVIVKSGLWHHLFPAFFPKFSYYGDINQKINFIDIEDAAELIVGTLLQTDFSGSVYFSGSRVSMDEATKLYNKARGTSVESKRLGSIEELKTKAEEALNDEKADILTRKLLGYNYLIFSGGVYRETDDNEKFGSAEVSPIEEFFKKNEVGGQH